MATTTDQIETHIEKTRDTLGSNLHELEQKVKSAADWKHHFRNNPMTLIGVAFGGGVLLATMMGGGSRRRGSASRFREAPASVPYSPRVGAPSKSQETWENIKGALLGVAATRLKDVVEEIVPGFKQHFHEAQSARAHSSGPSHSTETDQYS